MSTFLLLALFLGLSCHGIEGRRKYSSILPRSNADEYDCVDIYKQPAFDHPLLKNHKIQMAPSFIPEFQESGKSSFYNYSKVESDGRGCPEGMVPIHRPKIENLTDVNSLPELQTGNNIHPLTNQEPGKHFAMFKPHLIQRFHGAKAGIGLDNPPVKMNQISAAQIWFEDGLADLRNKLQVGWAVHPRIYGDTSTRLTAYWTADSSRRTGCYNVMCPGFVQVHPNLHLGSTYGRVVPGHRYGTHISVFRDQKTGNWWLVVENNIKIGYWPSILLPEFNDGALYLQFGGWTFNSPDGVSPPMGTGRFPNGNLNESGVFEELGGVDEKGAVSNIYKPDKIADNTKCYDAIYFGDQHGSLGQTFTYGGPGGKCGI